jgi:hypothetical protein
MRFLPHQIADAEPLLVRFPDRHDGEHHEIRIRARGAAAAVINGAVAFRRLVDDDKKITLVPGFESFARASGPALLLSVIPGRSDAAMRFLSRQAAA